MTAGGIPRELFSMFRTQKACMLITSKCISVKTADPSIDCIAGLKMATDFTNVTSFSASIFKKTTTLTLDDVLLTADMKKKMDADSTTVQINTTSIRGL